MKYADNLRKIDDIQKGGDYFKATIQLGDLAAELAAKLYKLQMTVAIKDEVIKDLTESRKWWRELNIPNPYLADEREEGMRL
jgi:hypothetical protein